MTDLLAVRDLGVAYANGRVMAVDGADLTVPRGAMLGLVGESGCGKTTLARALMGVLPPGASITRGSVVLDGTDLVALTPAERQVVASKTALEQAEARRDVDQAAARVQVENARQGLVTA